MNDVYLFLKRSWKYSISRILIHIANIAYTVIDSHEIRNDDFIFAAFQV